MTLIYKFALFQFLDQGSKRKLCVCVKTVKFNEKCAGDMDYAIQVF